MNARNLTALLLLLGVVSIAAAEWSGKWTDTRRFGRDQYFCVDADNNFYGVYSQLGFMIGKVSGPTVSGNWYEPGDYPCNNGTFILRLGDNMVSFSSDFICYDTRAVFSSGVETLLSDEASILDCGIFFDPSSSANITGHWYQEDLELDACAYSTTQPAYTISYEYELDDIERFGFERGTAYENSRVYQGVTRDIIDDVEASLWYMQTPDILVHLAWCVGPDGRPRASDYETKCHSRTVYQRTSKPGDCNRYEFLNPQTQNSAIATTASIATMAIVCLGALLLAML